MRRVSVLAVLLATGAASMAVRRVSAGAGGR
jgi:hypothetical protein